MKKSLSELLKKEGQAMDQLASQKLAQRLSREPVWLPPSQKVNHSVPWVTGIAAALLIGLLITVTIWKPNDTNHSSIVHGVQGFDQVFNSMDQKMEKPLMLERQAIIEDLKTLKKRMLSI